MQEYLWSINILFEIMNPNNSNKPLVSVIVPVYKAGQYFDECGKDLY